MKMLLVDDEPLELEQLNLLIKVRWPLWEIYEAEDAKQAIELAKHRKFNMAMIDIRLPGMSGLELIDSLKLMNPATGFIITSAYQDFNYAKSSIRLGVFDYLVKPIIEEDLFASINKLCQSYGFAQTKTTIVENALRVIWEDYPHKINLDIIAHKIYVNSTYLSKKFSEEMEMSLSSYIMYYRLEKSKILLRNKELTMAQIAEATGFMSQYYFTTVFKKLENITPTEYRRQKWNTYD